MDSEYSAAYSKLVFVSAASGQRNVFAAAGDPKAYLVVALGRLGDANPGFLPSVLATSPVAATIASYAAAAHVVIR